MSLITEQWLFVQDVYTLIFKAKELGYILTFGEAWRPKSQAWINSLPAESTLIGQSKNMGEKFYFGDFVGGVGIAHSKHMDRLAIDFNIFKAEDTSRICTVEETRPIGEYWESLSPKNRWGGDFHGKTWFNTRSDAPHFERNI